MSRLDGVSACETSFTTEILKVQGDVPAEDVIARVQELGYGVEVLEAGGASQAVEQQVQRSGGFFGYMWGRTDTRLALLAILLVLPGLIFQELLPGLDVESIAIDLAAIAAMLLAGYPVIRSAWRAVRINREININVLMTIAAVGAVIIGAYIEAAVVMVLFVIGEAMEGYTAARARNSIRSLMSVAPNRATRLTAHGEIEVDTADLRLGDRILIKPGERIAMDGRVLAGASAVNQAPITGEGRLIDKQPGHEVFAGCINGEGALEVEVTHLVADNTISRMIRLVEEAQDKRAPTQRFIDRFAKYYTPAVVLIAALVAIVPPVFFSQPFFSAGASTEGWLYRALALLVVACPCALVISTPVTLVSAISNAARNGVLFKGGAFIEQLGQIKVIAFDKTGTLTQGKPAVVAFKSVACTDPALAACADCDDVLALASALERRSDHPLAQAVVAEAQTRGLSHHYPAAAAVTALSGRGVTGEINGQKITIGSHGWFDQNIVHSPAHCAAINAVDAQGYTTMLVSSGEDYRGYIAVADTVRESSRAALAGLKDMGFAHLVMLTGDNQATAEVVAAQVGVTDLRANCLPAAKVAAVEELRQKFGSVAMVGDGINDTPALAAADVGIAIGATAQAMETADITLMADSLAPLPFAVELSRAAMRTVRANVAISLLLKFMVFVLVLVGTGTMWMAVLADVGTSLLVTANGMRLLRTPKMAGEVVE